MSPPSGTIQQALQQAWKHHQEGKLQEAARIYQQVLQTAPDNADALHLLGLAAHQGGESAKAVELIEKAVRVNPDNPFFFCSLAEVNHALQNFDAAIIYYERALTLYPDSAEVHNNLGLLLQHQHHEDAALKHFEQALLLNPDYADAHYNLGLLRMNQARPGAAIDHFENALKQQPDKPETHFYLGNAMHAMGRQESAIQHYQQAINLNPDYSEAHNNLATGLRASGALDEAARHYKIALEGLHDNPALHCNMGNVLVEQYLFDQAVFHYEQALALEPDYFDAHRGLGNVFRDQGHLKESAQHYSKALALTSEDGYKIKIATLLPVILESHQHLDSVRHTFSKKIAQLAQQSPRLLHPDKEVGSTCFYLAYHGLNDRNLQTKVAHLYTSACPELEWEAPHCRKYRPGQDKIRIGFVSKHFRDHSIGKISKGWVAHLSREQFSVTVFFTSAPVDKLGRSIYKHADEAIILPGDLDAARQCIAGKQLDIIIYPDIGMEPFTYFLAFSRLAPVQCTTFGHPVTTGIVNMDYFISTGYWEPEGAEEHYSEKLVRLPDVASTAYCYRPSIPQVLKSRTRLGFSEQDHLYLCAQTLFKFHPDFDDVIAGILRIDPAGILVLKDSLHKNWTTLLQNRFHKTIPDVLDRIRFLEHLPGDDYISLLAASDVILDPLHFGGFTTSLEALAVDTPIVTLPGKLMRGRHTFGLYRRMGISECIAKGKDDYINIALQLGCDREYRMAVSETIRETSDCIWEEIDAIRKLEHALVAMVGDLH